MPKTTGAILITSLFFSFILAATLPTVLKMPNRTVEVGQRVELSCHSTGGPMPSISWTLPQGIQEEREPSSSNSLLLENVTQADQGWYLCQAKNVLGSDVQKMFLRVVRLLEGECPLHSLCVLEVGLSKA